MNFKNLGIRFLSAIILAPMALWTVYKGDVFFSSFIVFAALCMVYELTGMTKERRNKLTLFLLSIFVIGTHYVIYIGRYDLISLLIILYLCLQILHKLFRPSEEIFKSHGLNLFTLIYGGLFIGGSVFIRENYSQIFNVEPVQGAYFVFMMFSGLESLLLICSIFFVLKQ